MEHERRRFLNRINPHVISSFNVRVEAEWMGCTYFGVCDALRSELLPARWQLKLLIMYQGLIAVCDF